MMVIRNWYLELDTLYVNEMEIEITIRTCFVRKIFECEEYCGNDRIFLEHLLLYALLLLLSNIVILVLFYIVFIKIYL